MDLADRVLGGRERELEQPQHVRAAADVGVRVLAEDVEQVVAALEQLRDPDLLLELPEELLLARRAHDVGVLVAVADVVERVLAADLLVALLQVDRRVVGPVSRVVVEVAAVDVDVRAAELVDGLAEAA